MAPYRHRFSAAAVRPPRTPFDRRGRLGAIQIPSRRSHHAIRLADTNGIAVDEPVAGIVDEPVVRRNPRRDFDLDAIIMRDDDLLETGAPVDDRRNAKPLVPIAKALEGICSATPLVFDNEKRTLA